MALNEIDALPNLKMVDLSMAMLNNHTVYIYIYVDMPYEWELLGYIYI